MGNPITPSPDDALPTAPRRPRTRGYIEDFGEGRVCATTDCEVRLSRYNRESKCWMHEGAAQTRDSK